MALARSVGAPNAGPKMPRSRCPTVCAAAMRASKDKLHDTRVSRQEKPQRMTPRASRTPMDRPTSHHPRHFRPSPADLDTEYAGEHEHPGRPGMLIIKRFARRDLWKFGEGKRDRREKGTLLISTVQYCSVSELRKSFSDNGLWIATRDRHLGNCIYRSVTQVLTVLSIATPDEHAMCSQCPAEA